MALTKAHNRMISGAMVSASDYAGSNAGEQIANAIDDLPATGGTIDARGYSGTQTFASDIFASRLTPFTLLLGNATFELDITSYALSLNSNQHIICDGTYFQPSTDNPTGYASGVGYFNTNVTTTTGSITSGTASLTLASTDGLEVGSLVAIDGASGSSVYSQTTLSAGIDASTTTIPLTDASDLPSTYTVVIGSEIIIGTEKSGNDLINVTRGAYGSSAVSHTIGATVSMSFYFRAIVESIAGSTVTLSGNASATVANARVLYGITNSSITGVATVDGRLDRGAAGAAQNTFGLLLKLCTRFTVGDNLTVRNWDHGGIELNSAWYNNVGGTYYGSSRPADSVGANVWMFRNSSFNTMRLNSISDSYIGMFIDDRTSSANLFDGPCNKNTVYASQILADQNAFRISGSNQNVVSIGYIEADNSTGINVATNTQGSTLRSCDKNTVRVGSVSGSPAACSVRDSKNYIEIGQTDDDIDVASTCDSYVSVKEGQSAGEYLGSAVTNPTWLYRVKENGLIQIKSTETSMAANDPIGRIEVYGSESSGAGAGIKGAFKVEASGGTGGNGQIKFSVSNGTNGNDYDVILIDSNGGLLPINSGAQSLGGAGNLWSEVFASTPTINTSDETQKQQIRNLSDQEQAVATRLKGLIKAFKFNSAVESKGDEARIHVGVIAQEVKSAFEAEGLDAHHYGVFCSDTWTDDDGVEHTRLGVRYSELFAFIISTL